MTWHPLSPTLVLNAGAYPGGWETIDLTLDHLGAPTGLPASRVLALVVVSHGGGWHAHEAVRPFDDGANWLHLSTDGKGAAVGTPDAQGVPSMPLYSALIVPTGPAGTIGFAAHPAIAGAPRSLWLLGWLDWTDTAAPGGTTVFGPAAAPLVWTGVDLTATIGAIDALIYLREAWTAGASDRYGVRRNGDPEDYVTPFAGAMPIGASTRGPTAGRVCGLVAVADAGIIEHEAAAAQTVQLDLLGYAPCTVAAAEVFAAGAAPAAWGTTLDLTVDTGATPTGLTGESLAVLRFTARAGAGSRYVAARRNGDALDYGFPHAVAPYATGAAMAFVDTTDASTVLIVSTDAAGLIEWTAETGGAATWQVELIAFAAGA